MKNLHSTDINERQRQALSRSYTDGGWYWPTGHDVLVLRGLSRRGLLRETTGVCEGCSSHATGHRVPVFCDADRAAGVM